MYLVSVIIPNYNNASFLQECISSVFNQTYQNIECIVVDDGSTDNSIQVLDQLQSKYSKLKYFIQENAGPSVARNLGIKKAKGKLIALLDSDDYWSTTKLENQVKLVTSDLDVISAHSNNFNDEGMVFPLKKFQLPPYTPYDFLARNALIGSCSSILFPRSIVKKIGYYDSSLRVSEDQEFHFRMALAGCHFKHSQSCDVHIRWHSNNTTKNSSKAMHFNLMAFEQQLKLINDNYSYLKDDKLPYNRAIIGRIGTIHYWAEQASNKKMKYYLNHLQIEQIGYLNHLKHKINVQIKKTL